MGSPLISPTAPTITTTHASSSILHNSPHLPLSTATIAATTLPFLANLQISPSLAAIAPNPATSPLRLHCSFIISPNSLILSLISLLSSISSDHPLQPTSAVLTLTQLPLLSSSLSPATPQQPPRDHLQPPRLSETAGAPSGSLTAIILRSRSTRRYPPLSNSFISASPHSLGSVRLLGSWRPNTTQQLPPLFKHNTNPPVHSSRTQQQQQPPKHNSDHPALSSLGIADKGHQRFQAWPEGAVIQLGKECCKGLGQPCAN
ncbi:uncharacterized protein LOC131159449 isoform X3 [Malania oleifera]|uniref:uncharacterized protein LOC131159449 isoform X3 n=1 Tax=Malania oleifera TaxID=397392 RepID=UPI0025ADF62B|nr:uncharacterized protein LOC131159449 isoform X3 [Malania oleifera]